MTAKTSKSRHLHDLWGHKIFCNHNHSPRTTFQIYLLCSITLLYHFIFYEFIYSTSWSWLNIPEKVATFPSWWRQDEHSSNNQWSLLSMLCTSRCLFLSACFRLDPGFGHWSQDVGAETSSQHFKTGQRFERRILFLPYLIVNILIISAAPVNYVFMIVCGTKWSFTTSHLKNILRSLTLKSHWFDTMSLFTFWRIETVLGNYCDSLSCLLITKWCQLS